MSLTSRTSSIWRRSARLGSRSGSIRWAARASHFWQPIIERYGIAATIVSDAIDPTFRFMTVDWDGKVRMDCSSPYAMARLIGMRDKFDVAFANDTDADRHGIVTRSNGLMNPNHYLAAAISYLFENRPDWSSRLRRRQDHRQQRHHRPRRRKARPQACRNAGGVQMVRRWSDRWVARLRRRRERRSIIPEARRIGLDHRQGRDNSRLACRRNHRTNQAGPRRSIRSAHARVGRALLREDRRVRDTRNRKSC